jgi:hypothetical protein
MTIFLSVEDYIVIIMSSESRDESLDRGDAAQQEQDRIIGEAKRGAAKGKQNERRDPEDRGEAVAQEQERIMEGH